MVGKVIKDSIFGIVKIQIFPRSIGERGYICVVHYVLNGRVQDAESYGDSHDSHLARCICSAIKEVGQVIWGKKE